MLNLSIALNLQKKLCLSNENQNKHVTYKLSSNLSLYVDLYGLNETWKLQGVGGLSGTQMNGWSEYGAVKLSYCNPPTSWAIYAIVS